MPETNSPNPIEVQKYLGGVDYPASKEELVQKARESGAPAEIASLLEHLPDEEFDSPAAVSKAVA